MNGIKSDTTKSAKSIAQQVARQMAREPLEILKESGKQVLGSPEMAKSKEIGTPEKSGSDDLIAHNQKKEQVKRKDTSLLSALQSEVRDIQKQNLIKDLQLKIQNGEDVYLEQYPELSENERQLFQSQIASVMTQSQMQTKLPVAPPSSKPGRRFGMGRGPKVTAEKQQTRVEKPIPPSG